MNINININDVTEHMSLANDVIHHKKKLAAKGTKLTLKVRTLLKKCGIRHVLVNEDRKESKRKVELHQPTSHLNNQTSQNFQEYLLEILSELRIEKRYGLLVHNPENIIFVQKLFAEFMHNNTYHYYLKRMYKRDLDTFKHSIDVFALGAMFLRELQIPNCEEMALGFLFHDIGKIKTPIEILRKGRNLADHEVEILRQHTTDGAKLLKYIGALHIAHMAQSHHERIDGTGYPNQAALLELPIEISILRLIDMYCAITMEWRQSKAKSPSEALSILFRKNKAVDEKLLIQFVEKIGIYPENAFVLLSNGKQAVIESINEQNPLFPTIRLLETHEVITLPIDFQLVISKLISYQATTEEQLFKEFSKLLINFDIQFIDKYYNELKEHLHSKKWFTHLYIPVYQIFRVLSEQNLITETNLEKSLNYFTQLIEHTIYKLRFSNVDTENSLLIINAQNIHPIAVQLFEGLLHSCDIYPIVAYTQFSIDQLERLIALAKVDHIYLIGVDTCPLLELSKHAEIYKLNSEALHNILAYFSKKDVNTSNLFEISSAYKFIGNYIK